ncbi:hypothetical protein G2W53_027093 [Senna tora]|uniref:Uncharacterized protein n=1 Tax=Senna tora TaxID=362788 RepID=A0A834TG56_9FABA|nr:hypothetical protein G2W53_027093 [Senna tora]
MGTEGLASRLLAVVEVIGYHSMETACPFGICCPFEGLSIREHGEIPRSHAHSKGDPIEWCHPLKGSMIPWFGTPAYRRAVIMGTEGLASLLLPMVAVIGCHLMETARPFDICCPFKGDRLPFDGNGPSLQFMLSLRRWERSDEVMPIQKAIQTSGDILCWVDDSMVWNNRFSSGGDHRNTCLALLDYLHWMSPFARVSLCTWDVVCFGGLGRCSMFRRTVALVMQRSSRHYTKEGCGRCNMSKEDCYLVDPTGSHMLISKIKPCMSRSWTVGWVERSASGVYRSARPFYQRCAPGLNWPGRAFDANYFEEIRVLKGSADVAFRTSLAPYEKSKFLGSGGSMVARLGTIIVVASQTGPLANWLKQSRGGRRVACVALSPPLSARVLTIASSNPNKNPGAGCAKEMNLTCVASANWRRFLSAVMTKMKKKLTLGNGYLDSRIDEEWVTSCLRGIWPPVIRALRMAKKGACAGQSQHSAVDEQMPRDRPCICCPYGWAVRPLGAMKLS